jgi:hypothetical protein
MRDGELRDFHGHFSAKDIKERRIHSKEHQALVHAFEALPDSTTDTLISIYCDNEIVRYTLPKGGNGDDSAKRKKFAKYLMFRQLKANLSIRVFRVPTADNVRTDWLSRLKQIPGKPNPSECMLLPQIFEAIKVYWSIDFTIDGMASEWNRQTDRFAALHDSDIARPVKANFFALDLTVETTWVFPPFAIVNATWSYMRESKAQGVIVIPRTPAKAWWAPVMAHARDTITIARRGEQAMLTPESNFTKLAAPLKQDLIAVRIDFRESITERQ